MDFLLDFAASSSETRNRIGFRARADADSRNLSNFLLPRTSHLSVRIVHLASFHPAAALLWKSQKLCHVHPAIGYMNAGDLALIAARVNTVDKYEAVDFADLISCLHRGVS